MHLTSTLFILSIKDFFHIESFCIVWLYYKISPILAYFGQKVLNFSGNFDCRYDFFYLVETIFRNKAI